MIEILISAFNQQRVELERQALKIDEMNLIPVDDLEEYYDITLDAIEDVKLLKKRLIELKKEIHFNRLYKTLNNLHKVFILHMDRMGQLETRIVLKEQLEISISKKNENKENNIGEGSFDDIKFLGNFIPDKKKDLI